MPAVARALAEKEQVEVRYYSVIYNLLDEVKQALSGMLAPETQRRNCWYRRSSRCFPFAEVWRNCRLYGDEGTVYRNKPIRVLRDDVVIYQGELESCVALKTMHRKFATAWNVVSA